jgi:hypothetical protein
LSTTLNLLRPPSALFSPLLPQSCRPRFMPAQRYAPLPNPQTDLDAEREMDDAFDDDDHDNHGETTPLTFNQPRSPISSGHPSFRGNSPQTAPNAYDFERDYDHPPPGSPPSFSTHAFPNNYGNSNGHLPTSPIIRSPPRSIFRRTFGALLPQYYQRIRGDRPRGGGTDNDGVFANVTAKPAPPVSVVTDNGDVYMVPEETQQEAPPVRYPFTPICTATCHLSRRGV